MKFCLLAAIISVQKIFARQAHRCFIILFNRFQHLSSFEVCAEIKTLRGPVICIRQGSGWLTLKCIVCTWWRLGKEDRARLW